MKKAILYLTSLLMLLVSACGDNDEPSNGNTGSPRDWTYGKQQIQFYINDVEQTSVSEITVSSLQLEGSGDKDVFPWYDATLKVKGLPKKNKVINIHVVADIDRFEGTTIYEGKEYNVTGVYTGNPFDHYTKMGIIVYLNEK